MKLIYINRSMKGVS